MARGRPPSGSPTRSFHIHLRLREGEDDDLIAFLEGMPARKRAVALKAALRAGGMQAPGMPDASDEDDLAEALDDFLK